MTGLIGKAHTHSRTIGFVSRWQTLIFVTNARQWAVRATNYGIFSLSLSRKTCPVRQIWHIFFYTRASFLSPDGAVNFFFFSSNRLSALALGQTAKLSRNVSQCEKLYNFGVVGVYRGRNFCWHHRRVYTFFVACILYMRGTRDVVNQIFTRRTRSAEV